MPVSLCIIHRLKTHGTPQQVVLILMAALLWIVWVCTVCALWFQTCYNFLHGSSAHLQPKQRSNQPDWKHLRGCAGLLNYTVTHISLCWPIRTQELHVQSCRILLSHGICDYTVQHMFFVYTVCCVCDAFNRKCQYK